MDLTSKCGTFRGVERSIDPGVKITITGRRIRVDSYAAFEADLPARLSEAEIDDNDVRICTLLMLLPLAAKFSRMYPELVSPWVVDELTSGVMPDRPERLIRSLRGAMTAAGVSNEAQKNILDAMHALEPSLF